MKKGTRDRGIEGSSGSSRGFTLIETGIVVIIIVLVLSIAMVGARRAISSSRIAAERAMLVSLRQSVEKFKQDFGFLPPLVNDMTPGPIDANNNPVVRNAAFLESAVAVNDPRYSVHSLPYYLVGACDKLIDGVDGPGFTPPNADGTFSRRGATTTPYFDVGRDRNRLFRATNDPGEPRIEIRDRWGNAFRYYRWRTVYQTAGADAGQVDQWLVPRSVGNLNRNPDPALRDAEFAVVSLGPDGLNDERRPLPRLVAPDGRTDWSGVRLVAPLPPAGNDDAAYKTTLDNLVEFGR